MNPLMHESASIQKRKIAPFSIFWMWLVSISAQAQLPTPVDPSSGAPNGNYLAFGREMPLTILPWLSQALVFYGSVGSCFPNLMKRVVPMILIGALWA